MSVLSRELVVSKTKGFVTNGGFLEFLTFLIQTEVIFMLYGALALISAAVAIYSFLQYRATAGATMWIVITFIFLAVALGCGAMFLAGRVNKTEDIHITE